MQLTVHQLIKRLSDYNPHARVSVFLDGHEHPFRIIHSGAEGLTTHYAQSVSLYVEKTGITEVGVIRDKDN